MYNVCCMKLHVFLLNFLRGISLWIHLAASRGAAGRWAAAAAAAAASICEWLPRVAVVSYGVGGVIIHEILGHLGWNHIAPTHRGRKGIFKYFEIFIFWGVLVLKSCICGVPYLYVIKCVIYLKHDSFAHWWCKTKNLLKISMFFTTHNRTFSTFHQLIRDLYAKRYLSICT